MRPFSSIFRCMRNAVAHERRRKKFPVPLGSAQLTWMTNSIWNWRTRMCWQQLGSHHWSHSNNVKNFYANPIFVNRNKCDIILRKKSHPQKSYFFFSNASNNTFRWKIIYLSFRTLAAEYVSTPTVTMATHTTVWNKKKEKKKKPIERLRMYSCVNGEMSSVRATTHS